MYIKGTFGNVVNVAHVANLFVNQRTNPSNNAQTQYNVTAQLVGNHLVFLTDWLADQNATKAKLDQVWTAVKSGAEFVELA